MTAPVVPQGAEVVDLAEWKRQRALRSRFVPGPNAA